MRRQALCVILGIAFGGGRFAEDSLLNQNNRPISAARNDIDQ